MRFRTCLPIPVLLVLCNCVSIYASNEVKCIENTNQCNTNDVLDSNNVQTEVLSRRRRYVAFPEGSSLSVNKFYIKISVTSFLIRFFFHSYFFLHRWPFAAYLDLSERLLSLISRMHGIGVMPFETFFVQYFQLMHF